MGHITYSTYGGRWWRHQCAEQCGARVLGSGVCQGAKGHGGEHWFYMPSGTYCWAVNGGGCGLVPPDHKRYREPGRMRKSLYSRSVTRSEVTDPAEVARLERGELREGEGMIRPDDDQSSE